MRSLVGLPLWSLSNFLLSILLLGPKLISKKSFLICIFSSFFKLCSFISLYRSSSQTQDESDKFTNNFELNLDLAVQNNPYLVVVLGKFNAKSKNWHGSNESNFEGNVLETLFSVWVTSNDQ